MGEMVLDLKDRKILSELEMNARINVASLGKKVGLSKQVVMYRIKKLEDSKIIQGYNALVDVTRLGQTIYVVYLRLVQISSAIERQWSEKIVNHSNILAVGKNAGDWDLTIVIRAENNQEFDKIFKEITLGKSDKIKDKLITSEIESTYFNTKLIHGVKREEVSTSDIQKLAGIDDKDEKIVNFLSENCRITLLKLSEKIGMSANGVKNKIKNLEKKGVIIGYKTKINYEKLGYLHFRVFIHLARFDKERYEKIKSFLKLKGNVESVSRYVGYADVDFRCYSKNLLELYELISEIKDKFIKDIIEINSMPIFGWEKIKYFSEINQKP